MKITKRQLRRIINEERHALLKEARMANPRGCFSPMKSRAHPEFAAMIKEQPGRMSARSSASQGEPFGALYPKTTSEWVNDLSQLIDQELTARGVWYEDEGGAVMKALEIIRRDIKDEMKGSDR